ncbi:hypothetical protein PanWU01x14_228200 [Parasponia andersonii]|uniref:Uncharacterized protein n=1 Tax=Parasponia andersonii TaxID=3476 RepID=A0A2P5BM01_PARAD|nr:hypothetical protein PanWU01x14_228200 [Parasponia andersonii]
MSRIRIRERERERAREREREARALWEESEAKLGSSTQLRFVQRTLLVCVSGQDSNVVYYVLRSCVRINNVQA